MSQGRPTTAIGERLHQARQQRQLSQAALAERVGLSLSTIVRIEAGQRSARPKTIQRLAHALDVSQRWLLLGDNDTDEVDAVRRTE